MNLRKKLKKKLIWSLTDMKKNFRTFTESMIQSTVIWEKTCWKSLMDKLIFRLLDLKIFVKIWIWVICLILEKWSKTWKNAKNIWKMWSKQLLVFKIASSTSVLRKRKPKLILINMTSSSERNHRQKVTTILHCWELWIF